MKKSKSVGAFRDLFGQYQEVSGDDIVLISKGIAQKASAIGLNGELILLQKGSVCAYIRKQVEERDLLIERFEGLAREVISLTCQMRHKRDNLETLFGEWSGLPGGKNFDALHKVVEVRVM